MVDAPTVTDQDDVASKRARPLEWLRVVGRRSALTSSVRSVALTLATYADSATGGSVRPGLELLIEDTGQSRAQVYRALTTLTKSGYLVRTRAHKRGAYVTEYTLSLPLACPDRLTGETENLTGETGYLTREIASLTGEHQISSEISSLMSSEISSGQTSQASGRTSQASAAPRDDQQPPTIHSLSAYEEGIKRKQAASFFLQHTVVPLLAQDPYRNFMLRSASISALQWAAKVRAAPIGPLRDATADILDDAYAPPARSRAAVARIIAKALANTDPALEGDGYAYTGDALSRWVASALRELEPQLATARKWAAFRDGPHEPWSLAEDDPWAIPATA